jgi:hypothetical protein
VNISSLTPKEMIDMRFGVPDKMDTDMRQPATRGSHIHEYHNVTTNDMGHYHKMKGITGPSIKAGASHVHRIEGQTSYDFAHIHGYQAFTGIAVPVRPGYHVHRYWGITEYSGGGQRHTHNYMGTTLQARDDR